VPNEPQSPDQVPRRPELRHDGLAAHPAAHRPDGLVLPGIRKVNLPSIATRPPQPFALTGPQALAPPGQRQIAGADDLSAAQLAGRGLGTHDGPVQGLAVGHLPGHADLRRRRERHGYHRRRPCRADPVVDVLARPHPDQPDGKALGVPADGHLVPAAPHHWHLPVRHPGHQRRGHSDLDPRAGVAGAAVAVLHLEPLRREAVAGRAVPLRHRGLRPHPGHRGEPLRPAPGPAAVEHVGLAAVASQGGHGHVGEERVVHAGRRRDRAAAAAASERRHRKRDHLPRRGRRPDGAVRPVRRDGRGLLQLPPHRRLPPSTESQRHGAAQGVHARGHVQHDGHAVLRRAAAHGARRGRQRGRYEEGHCVFVRRGCRDVVPRDGAADPDAVGRPHGYAPAGAAGATETFPGE